MAQDHCKIRREMISIAYPKLTEILKELKKVSGVIKTHRKLHLI